MSYLTSLNPELFQNIAYLGSFKHFVLICFTCIFATRPSPALTAVVYIIYDVQIGISALSLYIRHLYISPSPPDGFPHVANSQLKQGLRGRFLQLQVWVLEKKIGLGQLQLPNIRSNGY